ncbi:MAG: endo alpha-1,4 polygalactosaminidase [Bryobacterales bacterium]|nr:endo alpha-1,4 polygalactosaminidase [Bryobacterales bacterium]
MYRTGIAVLLFSSVLCAQEYWKPNPKTTWQWQLQGAIDLSVNAEVFDIDLFDNTPATVAAIHAKGSKAICYFSAGSFEDWRPDAGRFPDSVKGRNLDGWPGERWLDIRRIDILGPIMESRIQLCKEKGFDAVEPDNIDAYVNNSGFPLTGAEQAEFNRYLAAAAHKRGLSIALKNDLDQVSTLLPYFDFALNESCLEYDECDRLLPFVQAGKAVFHVEYEMAASSFCPTTNALGFNSLQKNWELDAFRVACTGNESAAEGPELLAVVSASTLTGGGVVAGQLVLLYGRDIGPYWMTRPEGVPTAEAIGDTSVTFSGRTGLLLAASRHQLTAIVPGDVGRLRNLDIAVKNGDAVTETLRVKVLEANPGLFTLNGTGTGQATAQNEDGLLNDTLTPAVRGSAILLTATGIGSNHARVWIGGVEAEVIAVGPGPENLPGVVQIQVRVPAEIEGGAKVPVVIESLGVRSASSVTLAVAP